MDQSQTSGAGQVSAIPNLVPHAEPGTQTQYAGFWTRVAAQLIDGIILLVVNGVLGMFFGGVSAQNGMRNGVFVIIGFLYTSFFESSEAQGTPGKQVMKIKVINTEGHRISFGNAALRYVGEVISGLILGIGYIMAAFSEKKQTLHDRLAKTYVVKK